MISADYLAFACSCGSLATVITVYAGMLMNNKPAIITGQCIGGLTLIFCILFFVLYL